MYSDKKTPLFIRILPVILLLLAVGMLTLFFLLPRKDISTESTAAIREAVERSARQCYAVEGIYPPNLQYLQDHYGLRYSLMGTMVSMLSVGNMDDPEDDRLFYYDANLPLPDWQHGDMLIVTAHDRI